MDGASEPAVYLSPLSLALHSSSLVPERLQHLAVLLLVLRHTGPLGSTYSQTLQLWLHTTSRELHHTGVSAVQASSSHHGSPPSPRPPRPAEPTRPLLPHLTEQLPRR